MYVYQKLEYNVSFEPWKKPLKAAFFEIYDDLRQQPTHFEQSEEKKIQGIYFLEIWNFSITFLFDTLFSTRI